MISFFRKPAVGFALLFLFQIQLAVAGISNFSCRSAFGIFSTADKAARTKEENIGVPSDLKSKLKKVRTEFELPNSGEGFRPLIEAMQEKLSKNERLTPLARAEKMAKFASALEKILSDLPKSKGRVVRYQLARSVLLLEAFKEEDFVETDSLASDRYKGAVVHLADYPVWVESYVKGVRPYSAENEGNILSVEDMRDLAAHNFWPVMMKPHDTRHVHYALGHPRGPVLYFMSARSMNHIRYGLMASMYEGVDTVQFSRETFLAQYFKKKGYSLEEAMVYIGRATHAELKKIMKDTGIEEDIKSDFVEPMEGWKPSYVSGRTGAGDRPMYLQLETDLFLKYMRAYRKKQGKKAFFNYRRTLTGAAKDDPSIHYDDYEDEYDAY